MASLSNYIANINTFKDFYEIVENMDNKQKGDLFEELTKYLFLYHPNYRKQTKNIWLYNDIPNKHKEELHLTLKDEGVDLLLYTTEEKWYTIQCKFRMDQDKKIPWKELSTF